MKISLTQEATLGGKTSVFQSRSIPDRVSVTSLFFEGSGPVTLSKYFREVAWLECLQHAVSGRLLSDVLPLDSTEITRTRRLHFATQNSPK